MNEEKSDPRMEIITKDKDQTKVKVENEQPIRSQITMSNVPIPLSDLQTAEDASQRKRKNDFRDPNMRPKRRPMRTDVYDINIRLLISSKDAGGIIGKKGSNITFLRQHYGSSVMITDCTGPERVLSVTASSTQIEEILTSIIGFMDEGNQAVSIELRLLLHTNLVGCIIGKNGSKLKEIRQQNNTSIKIFPQCCPRSSERVCIVEGRSPENVVSCIRMIQDIMISHLQLGDRVFHYNPSNYAANDFIEYGGFSPDHSQNITGIPAGSIGVGGAMKRRPRDFRNTNQFPFNANVRIAREPSNSRPNSRRFNPTYKNSFNNQHDMWNRNAQYDYDVNNWSGSNHMDYPTDMNNYQNSYQPTNYQASQPNDSSFPYHYVDSASYSSSSNSQIYDKPDAIQLNELNSQINHLNNNPMNSNQLNSQLNNFWTNYYSNNNRAMNQSDGRSQNLSVLTGSKSVLDTFGDLYSNMMLCICLAIGLIMTARIGNHLKRQNASGNHSVTENIENGS